MRNVTGSCAVERTVSTRQLVQRATLYRPLIVVQRLAALGVPFAVVTGYARDQVPVAMRGGPLPSKPVQRALLLETIREMPVS